MILSLSYLNRGQPKLQQGFTLIEIAIVLVIIGLLLGGLIAPLKSQHDVSNRQATELQLQEIRAALIGYAVSHNALPCPVAAGNLGVSPVTCASATVNHFVPYATLGIQGVVVNGVLIDLWQRPLIYTLVAGGGYETNIPITAAATILNICSSTPCPTSATLTTGVAVAVVLSTGRDGADIPPSASPDQLENLDYDINFVMRTPTEYVKTGSEFDDIVVWISHPTLIYELSRAGRL